MRYIYLFTFLFYLPFSVFSQKEALISKVSELQTQTESARNFEKLLLLDSLCMLIKEEKNFDYEATAKETIQLAFELDSFNLAAKHTAFLVHYFTNRLERPEEGLMLYEDFLSKNLDITNTAILNRLHHRGANSYFYSGQEQKSLDLFEQIKIKSVESGDSFRYGKVLLSKAFAMSEMGQFSNASQEYQKALSVFNAQKDTILILTAKVGLSVLYCKNAFFKESLQELDFVLKVGQEIKNYPNVIMALSFTAANHYNSGDYQKAIKPLKDAIELSNKYPFYNASITNDYKILANCYSKLDSLELAKQTLENIKMKLNTNSDRFVVLNYLDSKMNLMFASKQYKLADSLGRELFQLQRNSLNYENKLSTLKVLFQANKALGNQGKELQYFKEHTLLNDSINNILKTNAFTYYQTLYETEKRDAQIANQGAEITILAAQKKVQFQWMLLIAATLFSVGVYLYFRAKRNKAKAELEKNKKDLAEQKVKAVNLEKELLNKEIEFKNKDLLNFALEITQKQEWAEVLYQKFEKIQNAPKQDKEQAIENIGNEIRNKMIVDLESVGFHKKIEKLGSSFYDKLNERTTNLSKTELRLCSFIRMKLDTKTIAKLQNISPSSARTSRYRLRKKLKLNPNQELDTFIATL